MEENKQIERISRYEAMLDRLNESNRALEDALAAFAAAEGEAQALADYCAGEDWREDFASDEQGKLPGDLKRGVLSEDGAYNALQDRAELHKRINGED